MYSIRPNFMATERINGAEGIEAPARRPIPSFAAIALFLWERVKYRIATMGFDLVILLFMSFVLVAAIAATGGRIRLLQASVGLPLFCTTLALALKARANPAGWREEARHVLRDWVPFLLVVFIYENLHDLAGQVTGWDFAETLNRWDVAIFGIEPTIWAQRIFSPLATDLFSVSYALYFALPLFIMFLLSIWGMRGDFRRMALAVTLCFLLGFTGYVFLPASPPRYFIEHLYADPPKLYGLFLYDRLQGAWDSLSVISGGAFPSLHVGVSAVALIYAYRYRALNRACKAIWLAYIPLVLSLWFSTIYLRHHWVIDIAAGLAVAAAAYAASEKLSRVWEGLRQRYGLSAF